MEERRGVPFGLGRGLLLASLAALILWRLAFRPISLAWRDWLLLLALYALSYPRFAASPARRRLELSLMAYLLALYLVGQVPRIVESFGGGP
jgi:hypothetical protein